MDDRSFSCRVSPFRHLRVTGYLLLTAAFRSLSRLSSAPSAKASALRSSLLDLLSSVLAIIQSNGSLVLVKQKFFLSTKNRFSFIGETESSAETFVSWFFNFFEFLSKFMQCVVFKVQSGNLFQISNGDKEIRTPDPLLARQVLSQLSYTPIAVSQKQLVK